MNVVGKVSSFITQGMYSVATPFHPFGGAVDIVVVKQHDGTFRSTPWYIRFGKFQGVLKGAEKVVRIEVNGEEANFHMYLDNSGEAYFVREVDSDNEANNCFKEPGKMEGRREDESADFINLDNGVKGTEFHRSETEDSSVGQVDVRYERSALGMDRLQRTDSDGARIFYEFPDEQCSLEDGVEFSEYNSATFDNLGSVEHVLETQNSNSEVVLVSVDGHILTAPISSSERHAENVQLDTPQFHLGPGEEIDEDNGGEVSWTADYLSDVNASTNKFSPVNFCEENNETLVSVSLSESYEAVEEHLQQRYEVDDESPQDQESHINNIPEKKFAVFKRVEVFKSCLELSELETQSSIDDLHNGDSLVEVIDAAEDPMDKSPQSSTDGYQSESKKPNSATFERTPSSHDSPGGASASELTVEAVSTEKDTSALDYEVSDSLHIQIVSNEDSSQKQMDVDLIRKNGGDEAISPDESCKNDECERYSGTPTQGLEISLCGNLLRGGMGLSAAEAAFHENRVSLEDFRTSGSSIVKNENLVVRIKGKYLTWGKASHFVLSRATFGLDLPISPHDVIPVEEETLEPTQDEADMTSTPSRRWRLWPIPFRRVKTLEHVGSSNSSNEDDFVDSGSVSQRESEESTPTSTAVIESPRKQIIRTNVPTTDQIASLNLKEGQNMVNFIFSTRVLGSQKVEAHIYLWKWNTQIVISDVDGTITRSDVLGQFMPLVGKDWSHSGIARLFSAIKENGYQLLFLSARAIVQAYLTKSFLFNLKQDGKSLPTGPVVISPDGLFPSLYREVIRRAPHEFKIACLEDIKALFPPDYNPFYAGFGNRDTDELSYRKIGIPKGKIFIINPKGEVAINHRIDVKSYTSLHTLVNDMFPPTSLVEQEDYNSWNYWKMPLPDVDIA